MSKVKSLAMAALALAATASASQAAISVSIVPTVTGTFAVAPDGTVGAPLSQGLSLTTVPNSSTPAFYQVSFTVFVTGKTATQWIGGLAFGLDGISRTPGLMQVGSGAVIANGGLTPVPGAKNAPDTSDTTDPNFIPGNFGNATGAPVTINGPTAGANGLFNAMLATDPGAPPLPSAYTFEDFLVDPNVLALFTGAAGDAGQTNLEATAWSLKSGTSSTNQKNIGTTATGTLLGTVDLYWNGVGTQTLALNDTTGTNNAAIQYTQDNNGVLSNRLSQANTGTVVFGVATPEPASLGVLALGGVALLARRKKA